MDNQICGALTYFYRQRLKDVSYYDYLIIPIDLQWHLLSLLI